MKRRVTCYASSCLKFGSGLEEVATMFHLRYFRRPLRKVKLGRIWDASTGDNELPGEEKREIQETWRQHIHGRRIRWWAPWTAFIYSSTRRKGIAGDLSCILSKIIYSLLPVRKTTYNTRPRVLFASSSGWLFAFVSHFKRCPTISIVSEVSGSVKGSTHN